MYSIYVNGVLYKSFSSYSDANFELKRITYCIETDVQGYLIIKDLSYDDDPMGTDQLKFKDINDIYLSMPFLYYKKS